MKITNIFVTLAAVALVSACDPGPTEHLQDSIVETTPASNGAVNPTASFDPSNSVIPFPNNLLFAGSVDGTLNIPVADETNLSDPQVALNAVDGFSTVAPMSSGFSTAIDASSITPTSVKMYEVTLSGPGGAEVTLSGPGGAVVVVNDQLTFGVDFVATLSSVDLSQSTLAVLPLRPLDEKTSYMMVITDDLMASSSRPFDPSVTYRLIKTLSDPLVFCPDPTAASCALPGALRSLSEEDLASFETLRQIINVSEGTVAAFDSSIATSDIIQSWSFTTQSIGDVLEQVRSNILDGDVPASVLVGAPTPDPEDDNGIVDSPLGAADIYVGTVAVPYYLTVASGVNDAGPLASFWKGAAGSLLSQHNTNAVATSTENIPVMVSIPKAKAGDSDIPVVIYQHGITTNRATMLAVADSMAAAGMAVVAIDMPLHGLTGDETNGTENFYMADSERTFDLDLADNTTSAPGPDGVTDSSGKHFINLTNLLNTRDNVRQAVSDLFAVTYAIEDLTAGTSSFDSSKIYFLGHSLGAMVGTTFVALEENVRDAAFAFGGGSYPKVLDGSAAFGPTISAGLSAAGVDKGTADYESFMGAAQTVVDTADPINHASNAAVDRGIVYFEIVGGNTGSPSDLVVPNTVPDGNDSSNTVPAPLAGTEPILALMGLTQVNSDQAGSDLKHSVKFVVGNHSSLLSADADLVNSEETNTKVRTEIQTIAATFLASDGALVDITDDSLLQAAP